MKFVQFRGTNEQQFAAWLRKIMANKGAWMARKTVLKRASLPITGPRRVGKHADSVFHVAYSPDARLLASASRDGTIQLFDARSRQEVARLARHTDWVRHVAFSPDSKILASASRDRTIILWDMVTREPRKIIPAHDGAVESIEFSPDGQRIVSASYDGTARSASGRH